ncbi:MAG: MFS transporter [Mycobacterium leprae]
MRQLLRNRPFMLFWTGQSISRMGDVCSDLALGWLVLDLTNSAYALGMVMLLMSLPEALFALLGGAIVDRYDFRKVTAFAETVAGALTGSLCLLLVVQHLALWHVYVYALLFGILQALSTPILLTAMPKLVSETELQPANSLFSASENLWFVVGPLVAGIMLAKWGTAPLIGFDALSFLISGACVWSIRGHFPSHVDTEEPIWRSISQVFTYVRFKPVILGLFLLRAIGNVGSVPFDVLLVVWVRQVLERGPEVLGVITTALSLGAILGSLAGFPFKKWPAGSLVLTASSALGAVIVCFAFTTWLPLNVAWVFLVGYILGAQQVLIDVLFQTNTDPAMLGRVSSLRVIASRGLSSGAEGVCGFLAALVGSPPVMVGGGCLLALTGLLLRSNNQLRNARIEETESTIA